MISKPLHWLVGIIYGKAAKTTTRNMLKRFQQKPNSPLQVQSNESFACHLYVLFSHASKVAQSSLHYRLRRQIKQCYQRRARVDDCYANLKKQRFSAQWHTALQKDSLAEVGEKNSTWFFTSFSIEVFQFQHHTMSVSINSRGLQRIRLSSASIRK